MKLAIIFLSALTLKAALGSTVEDSTSFLGSNAIPGEFPYMVSLQWFMFGQSAHFCGGVIISNIWILTAANCITDRPNFGLLEVHTARHNLAIHNEEGRGFHSVINTFIHPGWPLFAARQPNDIGLIRLSTPIVFRDRVRAIRLPQPNDVPVGPATFVGWGNIGMSASILQKATLFPISVNDCRNAISTVGFAGSLNDTTNICTGPLTGAFAACNGDFGGPLVQGSAPNEVLVGIASWGVTPCRTIGAPSAVFTQVSSFVGWITERTGITV